MNLLKALFGGKTETPEEKAREEEARNFDVLKYDGVRAMRSGQTDYAVKCFTHALAMQDDMEIRDYLSQVYIYQNRLEEAMDELQHMTEAQPENVQVLVRMANVAYMQEDYDAMATACERALEVDGSHAETVYLYARAAKGKGHLVEAIARLTQAIALDETYGDAYLFRGETLLSMGDTDGADADARWLLEHAADHEEVLLLKARIENRKGNLDEALLYYNKVVEQNPFCVDAYQERGAIRMAMGDQQGAAADGVKVMELRPADAENVTGDFSAEGIEQKTRAAYRSNPLGLG